MKTIEATLTDVYPIAAALRESDRRELAATRVEDPLRLALDACVSVPFAWTFWDDGPDPQPIAALGASCLHRGVWRMWMFATDEIGKISVSLAKKARDEIFPGLVNAGAHRIECLSSADNKSAHDWIRLVGGEKTAELKAYGMNGEDFYVFSWVREKTE